MLFFKFLTIFLYIQMCCGQVTLRKNRLLSRKRRYLLFPEGSNFVITPSLLKAVMFKVPRYVNILAECDVPFKLPSDPRGFRINNLHHRQRKEIHSGLEEVLTQHGIDGAACVRRMVCDAKYYFPVKGKSLVGDLLSTIFMYSIAESSSNDTPEKYCLKKTYEDCEFPLLNYIIKSLISY